jgi:hypothetical protein
MTPIAPLSRIRADRSCCWFTPGDERSAHQSGANIDLGSIGV